MSSDNRKGFCLNNYDAIGFDLDHTLCKYKIQPLTQLIYELMFNYLVKSKNYPIDIGGTYSEACDFYQKGIVADLTRGNYLKLTSDYTILLAYHGTTLMTDNDILEAYGNDRKFKVAENILSNLCAAQPVSLNCFLFRDYFGIPSMYLSAKIIDNLDKENGGKLTEYKFWPDLWCAFHELYKIEHFQSEIGGYFSAIKRNPHRYVEQNSPIVLNWLKELKKTKKLFILTNSYYDVAELLLNNCIGPDWRDYFDFIGSHCRKPGFFTGQRPYLSMENYVEGDIVPGVDLKPKTPYSLGNWGELNELLKKLSNKKELNCLFFGDSVLDDVFAPDVFTKCDTVAVVEEIAAESDPPTHDALLEINSSVWGSFFKYKTENGEHLTFLNWIIMKHAQIAIPDIETLAKFPINKEIVKFDHEKSDTRGYFKG